MAALQLGEAAAHAKHVASGLQCAVSCWLTIFTPASTGVSCLVMPAWADGIPPLSVQTTCSRGVPQAATSCRQQGLFWWGPQPPRVGCQPASIAHPGRGTGTSMPMRCHHGKQQLQGTWEGCRCHHGKQQLQGMPGCTRHRTVRRLPGTGGSMIDSTWRSSIDVTEAGGSSRLAGSPLQAWSSSGRAVASSGLPQGLALNTTSLALSPHPEPRIPLQLLSCTRAAGSLTGGWLQPTRRGLAGSLLLVVRQGLVSLVTRLSSRKMLVARCHLSSWAGCTVELPQGRPAAALQQAQEASHLVTWLTSSSGSSKATQRHKA